MELLQHKHTCIYYALVFLDPFCKLLDTPKIMVLLLDDSYIYLCMTLVRYSLVQNTGCPCTVCKDACILLSSPTSKSTDKKINVKIKLIIQSYELGKHSLTNIARAVDSAVYFKMRL